MVLYSLLMALHNGSFPHYSTQTHKHTHILAFVIVRVLRLSRSAFVASDALHTQEKARRKKHINIGIMIFMCVVSVKRKQESGVLGFFSSHLVAMARLINRR